MKLKANRNYEAFFISDLHYLVEKKIKTHFHKELFKLLDKLAAQNIKFKRIYLVGDIIESWYFNSTKKLKKGKKRFNKLFDRFDALALRPDEKYFIVGNHDTTRIDGRLSEKLQSYLNERRYKVRSAVFEKNYIVAHGHQGQYGFFFWFFSIIIVRITYQMARMFPWLMKSADKFYRKYLNFDRHLTAEQKLKFYHKLAERLQRQNEVIICGHTHQPLIDEAVKIANCGDWVESRTFLIKQGKTLYQMHFNDQRKIVAQNAVKIFL